MSDEERNRKMLLDKSTKSAKTIETDKTNVESLNKSTEVELTFIFTLLVLLLRESIPEAKCFVACTCDDRLAIGAHSEIQHSVGVTGQGSDHV